MRIYDKPLDTVSRPYIIAEIGGNHGGDYDRACRLVQAAAEAGADAVKTQTYEPDEIAADIPIPTGFDPDMDKRIAEHPGLTLREHLAGGGLPRTWHAPLKKEADDNGIAFLSTPFSVDAARFLVEEIGVPAIKIASGDITFYPLLEYADTLDIPIILSTGGATDEEITEAVWKLHSTFFSNRLLLMHCISVYPCDPSQANLGVIPHMKGWYSSAPIGWSDHTTDILTPVIAVALGATVIEKHFKLYSDNTLDADHSLTPVQFRKMVDDIRQVPLILGHGKKEPWPAEMHDKLWARRSPKDWLRPTDEAREGRWE